MKPIEVYAVLAITTADIVLEIASYSGHNASVVAWAEARKVQDLYRAKFVVRGYVFVPE